MLPLNDHQPPETQTAVLNAQLGANVSANAYHQALLNLPSVIRANSDGIPNGVGQSLVGPSQVTIALSLTDFWEFVDQLLAAPGYETTGLQVEGAFIFVEVEVGAPAPAYTPPVPDQVPSWTETYNIDAGVSSEDSAEPMESMLAPSGVPDEVMAVARSQPSRPTVPRLVPTEMGIETEEWEETGSHGPFPSLEQYGPKDDDKLPPVEVVVYPSIWNLTPLQPWALKRRESWIVASVAFVLALLVHRPVLWPAPGSAPGADVYAHLFKVWLLAQNILAGQPFAQWTHWWWAGFAYLQYYSPLSYYLMAPIYLITGNAELVNTIFTLGCLVIAAIGCYLVGRRWYDPVPAGVAAAMYAFAPFTIRNVYFLGNPSMTMVLALSPFLLLATLQHIEAPSRRSGVTVAILVALAILLHNMCAFLLFLCIGVFAIVYTVRGRTSPGGIVSYAIISTLAAGTCLWQLVPNVLPIDYPDVPFTRPDFLAVYKTSLGVISPLTPYQNVFEPYIGFVILACAVTGVALRRDALTIALAAAAGAGLLISLGPNTTFWFSIPLFSVLQPARVMHTVSLFLALLAGHGVAMVFARFGHPLMRGMIVTGILALFLIDTMPFLALVQPARTTHFTAPMRDMATLPGEGRFAGMVNIYGTYAPIVYGHRPNAIGGMPEGAPLQYATFSQNNARRLGYRQYDGHLYALWNVRFALPENRDEMAYLETIGFRWNQGVEGYLHDAAPSIAVSDRPPAYVMRQDRSSLVVGRGASVVTMQWPWVAEGRSWFLTSYARQYLDQFNQIILYDFRWDIEQPLQFESQLLSLLRSDKMVILDTSFQDSLPLGMRLAEVTVNGAPTVRLTDDGRRVLGDVDVQLASFNPRGETYRTRIPVNPDVVLAEAYINGRWRPILAYYLVGGKPLYVVGLGLIGQAQLQKDTGALRLVESLLDISKPNKELFPQAIVTTDERWGPDRFSFSYDAGRDETAIVSVTYSPHWQVTIDGQPAPLGEHERLSLLELPAGAHQVVFSYGFTAWQIGTIAASFVALALLALALTTSWSYASLSPGAHINDYLGRLLGFLNEETE